MNVRAVFFDAGETLVYPHPSFAELFTETLRGEGRTVDPARVNEVVSIYSKRFSDAVRSGEEPRLWSTSKERSREFWLEIYRGFVADLDIHNDDEVERLSVRLYEEFSHPENYALHPDAIPTLDRLRARDLVLGVISNFEEWLEHVLELVGVTAYFPVRVISGVEGVEKPDRRIFEIALERTGASADESVYVGDHPFFDVEAARDAGMLPVLIDRRGRYPDVDSIRITSLEDLPEAIGLDA